MTKYNTAITIEKKIDDDIFMIYGFTGYYKDENEAHKKAKTWILKNVPVAERKNTTYEIEQMEFQPKEYSWV